MSINTSIAAQALLAFTLASGTVVHAAGDRGFDKLGQLNPGVSTRQDVIKLLGKPAMQQKMEGCTLCTWTDGDKLVTCEFSKDGVLQDVKEWKPRTGFSKQGGK
jgi:hypothetical protein